MNFLPARKLQIVVIEDHAIVVQGLKALLASVPHWEIVGHAEDGLAAVGLCARCTPDLVLLDLGLHGMSGRDVLSTLRGRWPSLKIVVLTASDDEATASHAMLAGASGYVLKKSSYQTLLSAIAAVAQNRVYLDPSLNAAMVESLMRARGAPTVILSLRERQVLKMILDGYRNREVAEKLSISLKTVQTHRLNLMRKLDAHNVVGLMQASKRIGLS